MDLLSQVGRGLCHILYPAHKRTPYPTRMYPGAHMMAIWAFNEHVPLAHCEVRWMMVPWATDGALQKAATNLSPCLYKSNDLIDIDWYWHGK